MEKNIKENIFHYTDFRLFLKKAFIELKKSNKLYSQRFISKELGVHSSGWLSDLLAGRRNLSSTQSELVAKLLKLTPREELFFETLVKFNQAKKLGDKQRGYNKLLSFNEIPRELIGEDRSEYFRKWYYAAIRELIGFKSFKGDYRKLANSLIPQITPQEAKSAINLLEKLGFITQKKVGVYSAVTDHIQKNSEFSNIHYSSYIQEAIRLGMKAIENIPREEREVSGTTVCLSKQAFLEIAEDINTIRRKLIQFEDDERKNDVKSEKRIYQGMFQIFPITKKLNL